MSNFRRNLLPGATFYFTVVTYDRRPILTTDLGRKCLREAIANVKHQSPFRLFSVCLLPDHLHCVWIMPQGDADYPTRWKRIKHEFSARWLAGGGTEAEVTPGQKREGRRGIWQRRYWEHTVRDEEDFERCVDYIHWNPRKHELVRRVSDWPYSSFHRFVTEGQYEAHWGGTAPASIANKKDIWGEPK
ncbi:MAG: transposase [Fuerstiella sp.]